jgi:thiamine biosynthesis lipoprotein ApbE
VTVISAESIDADGLGLTLFCLGPVRGLALAASLGIDAIMIGADHRMYATEGARRMLSLTDTTFSFDASH